MKKNGQEAVENLSFDDGRTGWKAVGRISELNKKLQEWLDRNEQRRPRRKKFGSF